MPNIASLFKAEITRLSRKEIRNEVTTLRKASAAHRREIAALKREIAALARRTKMIGKRVTTGDDAAPEAEQGTKSRFVAKGLRSMRTRLGLSADQLAKLLGVSMQSVYNWESKKTVPRGTQVAAIAGLRSIGKKEAHERLDAMGRKRTKKAKA
jgi:DNA-binding transcriptional regulator YiaG